MCEHISTKSIGFKTVLRKHWFQNGFEDSWREIFFYMNLEWLLPEDSQEVVYLVRGDKAMNGKYGCEHQR